MNIHRTKVYERRKFFLFSEDILQEVEDMQKEFIVDLVSNNCLTPHKSSEWDLDRIESIINGVHLDTKSPITPEELEAFETQSEIIESLQNYLLKAWDEKRANLPEQEIDRISRFIVLKSIDELWLEHIDQMTQLRDKVALSGYAQRDPIMEYKREGFEMFKELLFQVKRTSIQNLFRIQFEANMQMSSEDYSDVQTNDAAIDNQLEDTSELNVGPHNPTGNLPGLGGTPMTRQQRRAQERNK